MKFTFHATLCPPEHYMPLAKAVDENGFYGFTMPDSICYPKEASSEYPYNGDGSREFLEDVPFLEPFTAIPALGVVAPNLRFSTSVVKLPIRNPVLVAKQAATVAVMTNNRFAMGVGISPWHEDFKICGEAWEHRGTRMEAMIGIIRGLLTGEFHGHESEHYSIPECKICPTPTSKVPILIGGHAPIALKRTARIADGWIHAGGDIHGLEKQINTINKFRKEYGTDKKPFEIHAMSPEAFSLDGVKRLEDLGVDECIIGFRNPYEGLKDDVDLSTKIDQIKWFSDEIISKSMNLQLAS